MLSVVKLTHQDAKGNDFLDRDPEIFKYLLHFLRNKNLPFIFNENKLLHDLVKDEFDYFCIPFPAPHPSVSNRENFPTINLKHYTTTTTNFLVDHSKLPDTIIVWNLEDLSTTEFAAPELHNLLDSDFDVITDVLIYCTQLQGDNSLSIFSWNIPAKNFLKKKNYHFQKMDVHSSFNMDTYPFTTPKKPKYTMQKHVT